MSLAKEFKEFVMRGNVVDMAVGVVIGAAFGKIPGAIVEKVLMPVLGILTGGVDFKNQAVVLRAAEGDAPAVVLGWGAVVQSIVEFGVIALAIFALVKVINQLKAPPPAAETPPPPKQEVLLEEIRDLLKKK